MIREWEYFVKDAMHKVNGPLPGSLSGDNHIVVHDGKEYDEYADTFHLMAHNVWSTMNKYESSVGMKSGFSSKGVSQQVYF